LKILSKPGLKIAAALFVVLALWMLWGIAKKLFWIGVFVAVAYVVVNYSALKDGASTSDGFRKEDRPRFLF
jgi:hypothetical protein